MDDLRLPLPPSTSPSFLCPPSPGGSPRKRRLSTSSMDSSVSHASSASNRHRKPKRAGSRVSEFDDNNNFSNNESDDVTLLSFLQSTHGVLQRLSNSSRRAVSTVMKRSRPRPKLVCEGEILEQTSMICRDYVVYKLTSKELVSRKLPLVAADWPKSWQVIDACLTLEHAYPRTYSNVSRKLCMTMTSTKVVRVALNSFLEVLFEGPTTWGKVVSMFSVCSLFAEECALQGHTDYVTEVVDTMLDFTSNRILDWLVSQGGWDCFPCPSDDDSACDNFGRVLAVVLVFTAFLVVMATVVFQYWSCRSLES